MGQFSYVHVLGFALFAIFCIFGVSGGVGFFLGVLLGYKITRSIKLVARGSMIGSRQVWGVLRGFGGVLGGLGGSRGVCLTLIGHFLSLRKSCMDQIWFQTTHNGPTGPC